MRVPPRKAGVAVAAIQAKTDTQPVNQLNLTECLGGASSATQWYCPPDVGALRGKSQVL